MPGWALRQPIFAIALGMLALAALPPAAIAVADDSWPAARAFLTAAAFYLVAAAILACALPPPGRHRGGGREIATLLLCWIAIPVFAAVPLVEIAPSLGIWRAHFEMVAAFTTTGGTALERPADLPNAVHLWRGLVGWLGGLLTLAGAYVVLAPRGLGGFEVEAATWRAQAGPHKGPIAGGLTPAPVETRLARALRVILPVYAGATAILALLLSAAGEGEVDALVHAMSIMATSGISPHADGLAQDPNLLAEGALLVFMVAAASRRPYARASEFGALRPMRQDPELWMMAALTLLVTATLIARHWIGVLTVDVDAEPRGAEALWGTLFTVLSFLTTTGFVSGSWETARDWSGLENPGLILLGLAAIGGGAATTAGGIKLIRAYALMRHGVREMQRVAQPYSVLGIGTQTRALLREGPALVWSFVMLFIFGVLISMLALTALGLGFEAALVAAIAALSNTGPAFALAAEGQRGFADLDHAARGVLAVTMVLGRVELLALIAVLSPDAWQGGSRGRERTGKT
ncbi:MAG: potassium transporter TrkG [Paracoccaceae bacterium]